MQDHKNSFENDLSFDIQEVEVEEELQEEEVLLVVVLRVVVLVVVVVVVVEMVGVGEEEEEREGEKWFFDKESLERGKVGIGAWAITSLSWIALESSSLADEHLLMQVPMKLEMKRRHCKE